MSIRAAFSRWGFRVSIALGAALLAWLLSAGLASAKVTMDPPRGDAFMRECMDCHRLPNLATTEGVAANQALCQECHGKKECTRQVDGKAVSLRVDMKAFSTSHHQMVGCSQCHPTVGRSPHLEQAGAECLSCHPPHGEAAIHDPHLRVRCEACHHKSPFVAFDKAQSKVVLAKVDAKKQPISLADHTPVDLEDQALCLRCHTAGNQVGAATMVLPAKGVICFLCHASSLSIGSAWFGLALLIFVLGMASMICFWFRGSVAKNQTSGHAKLAGAAETAWRAFFSRQLWSIIKTIFFDVLLQRRLLKESVRRWFLHSLIYSSLLLRMFLALFTWLVYHIWPDSSLAMALIDKNHPFVAFTNDLLGLFMLLGVVLAALQRLAGPKHVKSEGQDALALLIIGLMVLMGFVVEGARILMTQVEPATAVYAFVGYPLSRLWAAVGANWQAAYGWLWYIHALLAALFVAYLPFSKMRHMFTTPITLILNRKLK